jgi:hypothetical protein
MGAQITPMKNRDTYGSPFFIGVICAPISVFCVSMQFQVTGHPSPAAWTVAGSCLIGRPITPISATT